MCNIIFFVSSQIDLALFFLITSRVLKFFVNFAYSVKKNAKYKKKGSLTIVESYQSNIEPNNLSRDDVCSFLASSVDRLD